MTDVRHTPGPWEIVRYGDGDSLVIHSSNVMRVCFMATPGSHGDPAKIEADAHLITAAPELLEALKACRSEIADQIDADVHFCCPHDKQGNALEDKMDETSRPIIEASRALLAKVDTALAKAEGRHD